MNGAVWITAVALFSIGGPAALVTWGESAAALAADDDAARYCRICQSHTMCRFPYDDPGDRCTEVESGDLEYGEIEWLVRRHNSLRQGIARARRARSHHRPPPPARDMMQVFWDPELARIARRWALQCKIHDKDECRDVERFTVRQSVSALDLAEAGNRTALERLEFHVDSWLDDDDVGYDRPSGLLGDEAAGLATPSVTNVGCGRATYSCCALYAGKGGDVAGSSSSRVEALVCNYGPIETELDAVPRRCETPSPLYSELCLKLQEEGFSRQKSEESYRDDVDDEELPFRMHEEPRWWLNAGSSAAAVLPSCYPPLSLLGMLLLLLHRALL